MKYFYVIFIGLSFVSCKSGEDLSEIVYVGNFTEKKYDFFDTFSHETDTNYYYDLPYDIKFAGLGNGDSEENLSRDYSWIREPKNLMLAFRAIEFVGFENFVSKEQYFTKNTKWCCDTQWDDLSPNDIIKGFLKSDTSSTTDDYYSHFWNRRRSEKNIWEVFEIMERIDFYYNNQVKLEPLNTQSEIQNLLSFDVQLMRASTEYNSIAKKYFQYLNSIGLDYSAYKLIFNNERITLTQTEKDSLLQTIEHDTISYEIWENLDDNWNSWIDSRNYPDSNRYYGP